MSDPAVQQAVESMVLRQVAGELVRSALPKPSGGAGGAYHDLFATVLADAVAQTPEAPRP